MAMTVCYLWLNAVLYAVFAALCSLRVTGTSRALGYASLNPSGVSEYLTVYGGLQVGLAVFFAVSAYRPELQRGGLLLALSLYAPIVVFRWASVLKQWPVERLTLGVGVLETALLVCAVGLWFVGGK
jgi:hypothetical protein